MGEARSAHGFRVVLADGSLIAIGQRGGDAAGPSRKFRPDVPAEAVTEGIEPSARRRMDDFDRSHGPSDATDPLEPCIAGEVVAAGQSHRRRRLKAGADADRRALPKAGRFPLLRHRHPHEWWKGGIGRRQRQPKIAFRHARLDLFYLGLEGQHGGPIQARRRNIRAPPPDQRASRGHRQSAERHRPAKATASHGETRRGKPKHQQ